MKSEVIMAKKKETVVEVGQADMRDGFSDMSVVYDLESLWEMKFRDPKTGEISMVRKAFKPRGKLEFYHPIEKS